MDKIRWMVTYDHKDGRKGTIEAQTEVFGNGASKYGNGKGGSITIEGNDPVIYDLRYSHGDLHKLMLETFFGEGLVGVEKVV